MPAVCGAPHITLELWCQEASGHAGPHQAKVTSDGRAWTSYVWEEEEEAADASEDGLG
jgi:hypothetical protein